MIRPTLIAALILAPAALRAQQATSSVSATLRSAAYQIAAAVTALPEDMKAGATVLGYNAIGGPLVTLRRGNNGMICLAQDPAATAFHAACYHESMEPFMARGRELRAHGVTGAQVDTVRFAEVKSGKLRMPSQPAMLYQIFNGSFDSATNRATGGLSYFVTYIPYATTANTGITAKPSEKDPWIMFPGTPKAHIMQAGSKM